MDSIARQHFPVIVRHYDQVRLFNPVLKKQFANRPEERVRLQWVEYLLHQTEWKKSRIGFEAPVKLHRDERALRADLILYQQNMKPYALIECKSESESLNSAVAEQAARYNSRIKAPYLALTNGIHDFWFKKDGNGLISCESPIKKTDSLGQIHTQPKYWEERGFLSSTSAKEVKNWIKMSLSIFYSGKISSRFLDFKESFLPFMMSQYYRVELLDENDQMAIGFLGEKNFNSYLVAVLNQKGVNRGVMTVNLDNLMAGKKDAAALYSKKNKIEIDIRGHLPEELFKGNSELIDNLPVFLRRLFD